MAPSKLIKIHRRAVCEKRQDGGGAHVGALLEHEDLIELAKRHGDQIVVPTGALIGLDAVTAAADRGDPFGPDGDAKTVWGLAGAPYIVENDVDIEQYHRPLKYSRAARGKPQRGFRQT